MKEIMMNLGYKNIALTTLFLKRIWSWHKCESETKRWRQGDEEHEHRLAENCYIDPYLLSSVGLYSESHLAFLLLLSQRWGSLPTSVHLLATLVTLFLIVTDCVTAHYCHGCLRIWFQNTSMFPVVNPMDLFPVVNSCELLTPTHHYLSIYTAGTWVLPTTKSVLNMTLKHLMAMELWRM